MSVWQLFLSAVSVLLLGFSFFQVEGSELGLVTCVLSSSVNVPCTGSASVVMVFNNPFFWGKSSLSIVAWWERGWGWYGWLPFRQPFRLQ